MAIKIESRKEGNLEKIQVFDEDSPDEKKVKYVIDKDNKEIRFFPDIDQKNKLKEIVLKGFSELPKEFNKKGYIKAGVTYYLQKKFEKFSVDKIIIEKGCKNSIRKYKGTYKIQINYDTFVQLKNRLSTMIYESKIEKSRFVDNFFFEKFPRKFDKPKQKTKERASKLIRNLDEGLVEELQSDDVNKLIDFVELVLQKKYTSSQHKQKLFSAAKLKIDDVAVKEVIEDFEKLLNKDPSESEWGKHLKKNLYLIDSKYVGVLSELNVVLAGTRKVDFGLVDSQGYLDLFEIKKPSTKLLAKSKDRGNHYWSQDAIKSIVQAEKYLFNAERKGSVLKEDIKSQRNVSVEVLKPRAFVLIGHESQLDTEAKKNDFRILRMSLKNIEVVLYNELLDRIKNQKDKLYID